MQTQDERRHWQRMTMEEDAIAVDDTGFQLGHVLQASGGGMRIQAGSAAALQRIQLGKRMQITIVEPSSGTASVVSVEIRNIAGNAVGMQFV